MNFKKSVAKISVLSLLALTSFTAYQSPAQAGKASTVLDIYQSNSGEVLQNLPSSKGIRIRPRTLRRQFESCVRGYNQGPSRLSLPTARNLCARFRR